MPHAEWCQSLGILPGDPIGGRVSRIEDPANGVVTLHLDTLSRVSEARPESAEWLGFYACKQKDAIKVVTIGLETVATGVPYDESGKAGTWRYPPRV